MTALSDLLTLIRQRSNMENNQYVTDAELTTYINNSLAELDDILVSRYEDYNWSSFLATLPSDGVSNTITLPSTVYKVRGLDYQNQGQGGPPWYTLYQFMNNERNRWNNSLANITAPYGKMRLSFRVAAQTIIIQPQAQAGGTYQVWFTPKYVPLVNPTDTVATYMDTQAWIEYAVVDCCIKICNKQNLDPSAFMQEKQALRERVVNVAKNRSSAGPKRVANVRFDGDGDWSMLYGWDTW